MDWQVLLLLGLATWRLSLMIVRETGPFSIFLRMREAAGITHDENERVLTVPTTFLGGVFSCIWCSSVWIGLGWMVLWTFLPAISIPVAAIFGLSGIAVILDHAVSGQNPR